MKRLAATTILALVLFSVVFLNSLAYGVTAQLQQPPGAPPYGLAVQGDAGGTKLNGVMSLEEYNFDPNSATIFHNARIVMRLLAGNDVEIFYGEINGVRMDVYNPSAIQDLVTQVMAPQILNTFFGADCPGYPNNCPLKVTLKVINNFTNTNLIATSLTSPNYSRFVMADLTIAVK